MGSLIGAIEAGGTKFVCAVGSGPKDLPLVERFPTTTPAETLARCAAFFREAEAELGQKIDALGVATFGPADVDPGSARFGTITTTPKAGWAQADVLGPLRTAFSVPMAFDTDVNGAAVGEWLWGAGQGKRSVLYLTVGTGIGGGLCLDGRTLRGLSHPEMGHVRVARSPEEKVLFPGSCPYHGDCLEGLASGPAIAARWGQPAETLPEGHPAWALEAECLAQGLVQFVVTLSPEIVIVGGGVGSRPELFAPVREAVAALNNGYVPLPEIVPPGLGDRAGVLGALALGTQVLNAK